MKKLTNEEIHDIVMSEGLGYAITSYLSADQIIDVKLKKLWDQAFKLLEKISSILELDE